ncbi:restriction endonuclease subunit S [Haemophilus parahaemolyticus]|uniref:restriction endonuclease subunit S n=1 Tax=Haemophilus parahaemolyticus TaxID=735 RepID=UPI0029117018|nr:restriction endonuclease subunit S [Haemophilus parahaemolyticus]MDU4464058.1 restriction endonuclease subunit S [Haemophilus parahaemolyticus]
MPNTITWEQRKLGDVVEIIGGGTPDTNNTAYWNGNIDWYSPTEIGNKPYVSGSLKKISVLGLQKSSAKILPANKTILFTSRAGIGDMAILTKQGTTNQGFQSFILKNDVDIYFLYSMGFKIKDFALKNASGSTFLEISKSQLSQMKLYLPSLKEQTQIGNFFKQLDDTIALHQRELEKFKILKTSYLENIFLDKVSLFTAKNTITWEQRKLGEVVERITRKNLNLESRLPLTISAQDGLISQTEFFDKQVASKNISGYYLIENGEFAYNKSYSNGYPWGAIKRLDKYKNGVLSTLYIVFKPIDVDSQFLVSYFDTTFWHSEIAEIAVEGARNHGLLNIPVMDFFRIKIKIPKSKEEQTQIGNFFKQLDDTIALHQKELAKYQQIKTACLEKMFVE